MRFVISEDLNGIRLDKALTILMAGRTRSELQKTIKRGDVSVNDEPGKNNTCVYEGDRVMVQESERTAPEMKNIEFPKILYEDENVVVLCKPIGLVVHPSRQHPHGTLVDFLLNRYPEITKIGDDPNRPGIVHRLDKDASGVMVIARNQESFDSLKRQFKLHHVDKEYRAIVYGTPSPLEGTISLLLGRRNSSPKIVASTQKGRVAITHYWVEKKSKFCSLVRVIIETGRTHQIRAHFYAIGHPLLGDKVYASKKIKQIAAPRLMLHAYRLEFTDLAGKKRAFICDIPDEFDQVLTIY